MNGAPILAAALLVTAGAGAQTTPSAPVVPSEPSPGNAPTAPVSEPDTRPTAEPAQTDEVSPTPVETTPIEEAPANETTPVETTPVETAPVPTTAARSPIDPNQELTKQDRTGDAERTRERLTQVTLSYSTALALGETRAFVGDFSFIGFGLDWHRRLDERFSAGLSLGWQVLYDKTRDTTVVDSLTVTGVQLRHLNTFPVLLSARILPRGQRQAIGPYIGLGVGVYPSEWRSAIGLLSFSSFSVHFGLAPEIGFQIPTRSLGHLCLGVKYNYAFESGGNPEISYLQFTVGVAR